MLVNSIRNQLFITTLAPLLLVTLLVSAFLLLESLQEVEDQLDERGNDIAAQAVSMSEFYFFTGDMEKLSEIADLLVKIDGLVFIRFINSQNQLIIEKHKALKGTSKTFVVPIFSQHTEVDDFPELSGDLPAEAPLGIIEIGLSSFGQDTKKREVYWRVLLVAIIAAVLALLLAYISSHNMTRALTSLMSTARDMKLKRFSKRCAENGSGELRELQSIFNEMAQSLEKNEQALQRRIETATRSLHNTVKELSEKNRLLAIQRRETIELERSKAISDERARIMKDMHDGIGGQIVASLAMIEKEPDSAAKQNIAATLTECLDDFRLIINSLNANANSLTDLLADFKYRHQRKLNQLNIELQWQVEDSADNYPLQPQQSLNVLRILQEAFTNIYKHANANRISFQARSVPHGFALIVEDSGQNFCLQSTPFGQGMKNMHWRADQLGAVLMLDKSATGGCRITLLLPQPL